METSLPVSPYLWQAEHQRQPPGQQYEGVPALRGPAPVCLQGAADGVVAVQGHGHDHVGRGKHPKDLQIFHQTTEKVGARKAALGVPNQLRQHLREEEKEEEGEE